jgi:hypothetical protein
MLKHLKTSFPHLNLSIDNVSIYPERWSMVPYLWCFKDVYHPPTRFYKGRYPNQCISAFLLQDHLELAMALKEGRMWAILKEVGAGEQGAKGKGSDKDKEMSNEEEDLPNPADMPEQQGSEDQHNANENGIRRAAGSFGRINRELLNEIRDLDYEEAKELLKAQIMKNKQLDKRIKELEATSRSKGTNNETTTHPAFSFHQQFNFDSFNKMPLMVDARLSRNGEKVMMKVQSGGNEAFVALKLDSR